MNTPDKNVEMIETVNMIKHGIFLITFFLLISSCSKVREHASEDNQKVDYSWLKENFQSPPRESGVNCWWWWLNGNVNKAAITKDLEAMKNRNFQGAMIFDAGGHNQRGNKDIPQGPLFGSDEWNELFVFALDEAKRLGLQMGFNIQSGWNLGGPGVTPQYAAKQITYSLTNVSGDNSKPLQLEQPGSRYDFYQDIAVLAFPLKTSNKMQEGISDLDLKLGFRELGMSAPDCRFLLENEPSDNRMKEKEAYTVKKNEIINLSSMMDAHGNLNWETPAGEWVVLRIGYTCTDSHVSTSSSDWQGSVLDYMRKEAFDFYWSDVVEPIIAAAGEHVGTTLKYMETDSWECGGMNWTDKFAEEFMQYRGYDLMSYLPIAAGYVVDDIETSNAFLADFRKTIADLVAYNHYARFQEYAHKYNMGIQPESAGPHAGPMDGIKNYGFSDIVMSEFWSPSPHRPRPDNRFYLKQASSAAHIYGKKIIGAESFTTIGPHWNDELWHDQKSAFDHEICAGLNRMYFHTFTCSPPEMGLPGQEYFAGTHVNPQVTWWEQSGAFIDYMHRVQSVVQEGKFVADVLYYYGDHVPNVFPYKHSDPAGVMPGFDYDVTDETIFLKLKVKNGRIVVPGGVEYRVLVLPDHKVLSLAVLEKLEKLVQEGATVLGHKPEMMVSLVGGAEAQKSFSGLCYKIWGDETSKKGEKQYGKGKVAWGMSAQEYLLSTGIRADFDILENDSKVDYDFIHYKIGESDVYFVTNQTTERQKINGRFRLSGKQPELWDAITGDIREARAFVQEGRLTTVPLTLEPYGAVMVVFNEKISKRKQGTAQRNYPDFKTMTEISGEWTVEFDTKWGCPESVLFPELMDWIQHSDEGIKYYSGAAVYNKTFNVDFEPQKDKQYFLQLGSVKDVGIAEVKINGINKGIVWTSPFRIGISKELQKGENTLEIKVVNSWYNRVAGDQMSEGEKKYTSTNIQLKHDFRGRPIDDIPLEPSGLLGPVMLSVCTLSSCLSDKSSDVYKLCYYRQVESGKPKTIEYDVVVYGGTPAGVTAAIQTAREGKKVVLLSFNQHVGGMTSGGLTATDIGNKESIGGLALEFYTRIGRISNFRPSQAESLFLNMLDESGVPVLFERCLESAEIKDGRLLSITMETGETFKASMFVDATYEGDLLAAANVSYRVGREPVDAYGESLAGQWQKVSWQNTYQFCGLPLSPYVEPGDPETGLLPEISSEPPGNEGEGDYKIQAYNFRIYLTDKEGKIPFAKPPGYKPGRYALLGRFLNSDPQIRWTLNYTTSPMTDGPVQMRTGDSNNAGSFSSDYVGGNYYWPDGTYEEGSFTKMSPPRRGMPIPLHELYKLRESIFQDHVNYQKGLMYFLANDPQVPESLQDRVNRFGLHPCEFQNTGFWPHQLYIREGRRMVSAYVMTQANCESRTTVSDGIGLGSYAMDSHFCQRVVIERDGKKIVKNEGGFGHECPGPYPVSYRSIVPKKQECRNLLVPVCLSASHVAYGSIRMEPVFMILGQSAGTAAVLAIDEGVAVQDISYEKLKSRLLKDGQIITLYTFILPELTDWTDHKNEGIKYYSGKEGFKKKF